MRKLFIVGLLVATTACMPMPSRAERVFNDCMAQVRYRNTVVTETLIATCTEAATRVGAVNTDK